MGGKKLKLTKAKIEKIEFLSKEVTQSEAVKILKLSGVNQLKYICKKHSISFTRSSKPRADTALEKGDIPLIKQLKAEGIKAKDIAEKFEISLPTVYRVLKGETWGLI